jgi:hypothetical protein
MKRVVLISLGIIASALFLAFKEAGDEGAAALAKFGIPEEIAKDCIWTSFSGQYLSYPDASNLKRVAVGDRATVVRNAVAYAKQYVRTRDFEKKYLEYRDGQKPTPPEKPKSMEEQRKEQKAQMQKVIKETEENIKAMPAEQQSTMKDIVKAYKEQLKALDDPANPMFSKDMENILKQGYDADLQQYKEKVAEWEKEYPTKPDGMIKKWLRQFLKESENVDFNAQLIDGGGGTSLFARTEYERKSGQWKMCFRAGKATVEAGRAAAKQWLNELDSAK